MPLAPHRSVNLVELLRLERRGFAARLRVARAVLGLSQSELGRAVGLTQRAIHKLEQGDTEPRRATQRLIEELFRAEGLVFEDLPDGGFNLRVAAAVLDRPARADLRRLRQAQLHRGVTALGRRAGSA